MEARKQSSGLMVTLHGTFRDASRKEALPIAEEEKVLLNTLLSKINNALNAKLAASDPLGGASAALNEWHTTFHLSGMAGKEKMANEYCGILFIIEDINNACNLSSRYTPFPINEIKKLTKLHQAYFQQPPSKSIFSQLFSRKPDIRAERVEFIRNLFGNDFETVKLLCARYTTLMSEKVNAAEAKRAMA